MSYSDNINDHPFLKRGSEMRLLMMQFMADDWVTWERLLIVTKREDYSDETVRRAVREGCDFGVMRKRGGKFSGGKEPAQVGLTPLGMTYLADIELEMAGVVIADDEVEFCEHDGIVGLCDICDDGPVENVGVAVDESDSQRDG